MKGTRRYLRHKCKQGPTLVGSRAQNKVGKGRDKTKNCDHSATHGGCVKKEAVAPDQTECVVDVPRRREMLALPHNAVVFLARTFSSSDIIQFLSQREVFRYYTGKGALKKNCTNSHKKRKFEGLRQTSHSAGHWRFLPLSVFLAVGANFFQRPLHCPSKACTESLLLTELQMAAKKRREATPGEICRPLAFSRRLMVKTLAIWDFLRWTTLVFLEAQKKQTERWNVQDHWQRPAAGQNGDQTNDKSCSTTSNFLTTFDSSYKPMCVLTNFSRTHFRVGERFGSQGKTFSPPFFSHRRYLFLAGVRGCCVPPIKKGGRKRAVSPQCEVRLKMATAGLKEISRSCAWRLSRVTKFVFFSKVAPKIVRKRGKCKYQ